jgi:hypothetical protein
MPTESKSETIEDQTARAVEPAAICSPLRVSYSLAEIEERLKKWMVDEFGHPRDYLTEPEQKDKWYRDYGLIYHFMRDQFPANVKTVATEGAAMRSDEAAQPSSQD